MLCAFCTPQAAPAPRRRSQHPRAGKRCRIRLRLQVKDMGTRQDEGRQDGVVPGGGEFEFPIPVWGIAPSRSSHTHTGIHSRSSVAVWALLCLPWSLCAWCPNPTSDPACSRRSRQHDGGAGGEGAEGVVALLFVCAYAQQGAAFLLWACICVLVTASPSPRLIA